MDSPSAPQAVDPHVQADAQFGLNRRTALLGNQLAKTDSYSPTESTTWSSSIDPQDQANYDAQMARYQENMTGWQTARDRHVANPTPARSQTWSGDIRNGYQTPQALGNAPFNLPMPEAPNAPIATKWTSKTQLTPSQQKLFDLRENAQGTLLGQANNNLRQPLDFSGLDKQVTNLGRSNYDQVTNLGRSNNDQVTNLGLSNDFSGDRQRVEDALYSRSTSRLDPQFQMGQRDLETKLYNQGVQPGTEAWNREIDSLARQKQDAYSGARTDAITGGGQEQSRLYGMDYQTANQNAALQNQARQQDYDIANQNASLQNQARQQDYQIANQNASLQNQGRQQGLNELFAMRQTPLQELNLLQGRGAGGAGAAGGGAPGGGGQSVANTDIGGAFASQLGADQAGYQGKVATNNANTAAVASMVATIAAAV